MENKENKDTRGLGLRKDQSSGKATPKGKSWFFGIGINNYSEFSKLNNAVNDIESIQNLLVNKYDVEPDCTITVLNEAATREHIIDELDSLVKKIQPEDKLIIYYSGHGHLDKNTDRGYWIPHDAQRGKTSNYIRNSTIREFIKDLRARHVLLISDSCFSGTLFVRGANRSTAAIDELETIPSRWAICSGRHDEEVYDGNPGENSPFAQSILETLSNNQKPAFNVVKLADRVVEQTRSNYKQLPEGNPLYEVGHKGGQYVFHLKKDEAADWKECVEKATIVAYNAFLMKYPDGKHTADARVGLKRIKAIELWQQIEAANEATASKANKKLQLINQYIKQYDDQKHYGQALDLGELLDYKKHFFQAQSSEYALRKFLRRSVPNVSGATEILAEAKQLIQQSEAGSALKRKEEEERLAEIERIRLTKEEQIAKQKEIKKQLESKRLSEEAQKAKKDQEELNQQLTEKYRKAEEARKAKQSKEAAHSQQHTGLHQKPKESFKQPLASSQALSQNKKYGIYAGLAILGLIVVIFIVRAFSPKGCIDPVNVFTGPNGKMGLKLCEKEILPPTYDNIADFSEGFALVKEGNLFGFIDEKGTLVIETKYEKAESFSYRKALVSLNGNDFYINKIGECIENCPEAENKYKQLIGEANTNFEKGEMRYKMKAYAESQKYYVVAKKYYGEAIGLVKDDREAKYGEKKVIERLNEINKLEKADQNTPQIQKEEEVWKKATAANTIAIYKRYLKEYPKGKYSKVARENIKKLSTPKYVTDKRSGYKTIKLNGKTWLAENLNLKVDISWCYNDDDANCHKYGRLYTWKSAKEACRAYGSGWRLPKKWEWNELIEYYNNKNTSVSTFNILLGGQFSNHKFFEQGSKGYYWHAAEDGDDNTFSFELIRGKVGSRGDFMSEKEYGYSCRCIHD